MLHTALRPAALLAAATLLASCGSTPDISEVRVESSPPGATVTLSRSGDRVYQGKVTFVKGRMRSEPFREDATPVGTTPVTYSTPLEEITTDATLLGVGGRAINVYKEGIFRIERDGYEPAEQYVRFSEGEQMIKVVLQPLGDME